jgi:glycosyltransferase involved in cell wall biosynthesis
MNPKVLIVCEHASSAFGGEAILPLNYFMLLSEKLPGVFLLTHERTRKELVAVPGINLDHVFFIPDTWVHKFLHAVGCKLPARVASITSGALMHLVTQIYQWRMARKIVREHKIDIIHEPAPVSPKQPSMMFALGVPVVIGPMNGGMSFPPAFQYMASSVERWMYSVMRMFSSIYNVLIPGKLFASVLLVANRRTQDALPFFRLGKVVELVENGVFLSKVRHDVLAAGGTDSIKVVYVGRLVDWKAIDIAIAAIGKCGTPGVKLEIVGNGVERARLEKYAASVAPGRVSFLGAVPHANIQSCYDNADIFVLPSVRECGGAVVLEAMARGLPVIATNWGGPADYVTSATGLMIDPLSREYMVDEFARNIDLLASDPQLRLKYGQVAIEHVLKNYIWEKKVETMVQLYQSILQGEC